MEVRELKQQMYMQLAYIVLVSKLMILRFINSV